MDFFDTEDAVNTKSILGRALNDMFEIDIQCNIYVLVTLYITKQLANIKNYFVQWLLCASG